MDTVFAHEDLALESLEPAGVRKVFEVWQEGAAGRPFCPRANFRAERLGADLYRVMLVERGSVDGTGFRLRLTGAAIEDPRIGLRNGGLVESIKPAVYRDYLLHWYRSAFAAPAPAYHSVQGRIQGQPLEYRRLTLPMSVGGEHCDLLLVAVHKTRAPLRPHDRLNQQAARM